MTLFDNSTTPPTVKYPPKKILVALPAGLLSQIDFIAACEHRNRSDLVREALRRYLENFKRSDASKAVSPTQLQPPPSRPFG